MPKTDSPLPKTDERSFRFFQGLSATQQFAKLKNSLGAAWDKLSKRKGKKGQEEATDEIELVSFAPQDRIARLRPESLGPVVQKLREEDAERFNDRKRKLADRIQDRITKGDKSAHLTVALKLLQASEIKDVSDINKELTAYNKEVEGATKLPLLLVPAERKLPPDDDIIAAFGSNEISEHIKKSDLWGNFDLTTALDPSAEDFAHHAQLLLNILESAGTAAKERQEWERFSKLIGSEAEKANPVKSRDSGGQQVGAEQGYDRSRNVEQASPTTVYQTAILGAGASAAYYISNSSLDLRRTVVIGQKDPWAGERGGEENSVINHPHNMIDPEGRPDFSGGLAKRSEFAERVAKVIDRVPNQCDGRISKVKKVKIATDSCYTIETNKGTYFAQQIISALGIGGHQDQLKVKGKGMDDEVHDMDTFMRKLPEQKESFAKDYAIAVCGANAAIDVVTAIIRKGGAHIHWFCGKSGTPTFLEGTDNDIAKKAYNEGKGGDGLTVIKDRANEIKKDEADGRILINGKTKVDKVVYGLGPDVAADSLFDESCFASEREPLASPALLDKDQHFKLSLFENNPDKILEQLKVDEPMRSKLLKILNDPPLAAEAMVGNPSDALPEGSAPSSGPSLIGGHENRHALTGKAKEERDAYHKAVNETLPGNVVMGDQLTSSRAQIEAEENALPQTAEGIPLVTEKGGVNFITSNQTVIATHIAACYPNIPQGVADYLTAQIVVDRTKNKSNPLPQRPSPESSHNLEKQSQFQEKWKERLAQFDAAL